MSLRAPLGRVLGLGSAKDGTGHFWGQRVSAIALAILGVWFCYSLLTLGGSGHFAVVDFIARPINTVLLSMTCVTLAYHSELGVQVVIEDYVHGHGIKVASLIASKFAHVLVAVMSVYAVLDIGLGS